ncbi:MAG: DUF4494 domain-containing protein [Algoriphagus sp.]
MRTWFLCKVKYAKETEEGLLKSISEQYLVDAVSFTEAETILYAKLSAQIRGDFQVTGISKSNIVDVFFYKDAEIWYKCKVTYLIADGDSGKEKKVTQYMIVTAVDVKQAYDRIQESLGSMLVSFRVPDITESAILEVFPFEKSEVSPDLPTGNFKPVAQELEEE